jgi:heptaprenyl diphosphate synthase
MGELRQEINNRNFDLSFYNYLKIISGKTAALFEASFRAGAELCDSAKEEARLYSRLGRYTGIIFQLTDDCIDYESTAKMAKKPVLSDFRQGVITLPLIYTLQKNAEFKNKAKAKQIPKEEISSAVSENGGIDFTRMISRRYYDKALFIIDKLSAGTEKKERLAAILNKAFNGLK